MVHISVIEARLEKLGFRASRWFRPEIRELQNILMDNEEIIECAQGRYFGGFALLVATNHRLLLIDKKVPYLSIEDIRYDMISEINFSSQLIDSTVNIYTVNKQHRFSSWKHKHQLRRLTTFAQRRVMEIRQLQNQGPQDNPSVQVIPPPTIEQAYNYDQTLRLRPPVITLEERRRLPSPHMPRLMGATALNGARRWVNPNPYTRGSLAMRRQWSHPNY